MECQQIECRAACRNAVIIRDPAGMCLIPPTDLVDPTRPLVVRITSRASQVGREVMFEVLFARPVTGLVGGMFTVGNGTVTAVVGVAVRYRVTVLATAAGNVTLQLPAARVTDSMGIGNLLSNVATTSVIFPIDVAISGPAASNDPFQVVLTFSRSITSHTPGNIRVTGGVVTSITVVSGTVLQLLITPDQDVSVVTVQAGPNTGQSVDGSQSLASRPLTVVVDLIPPSVVLSVEDGQLFRKTTVFDLRVTFTERIAGYLDNQVSISNATTATPTWSIVDRVRIIRCTAASANSVVSINYAANQVTDPAGNLNVAAIPLSVVVDNTPPTASWLVPPVIEIGGLLLLQLSEDVQLLSPAALMLLGCTLDSLTRLDARSYAVQVTRIVGVTSLTVRLRATHTLDLAGNQMVSDLPVVIPVGRLKVFGPEFEEAFT